MVYWPFVLVLKEHESEKGDIFFKSTCTWFPVFFQLEVCDDGFLKPPGIIRTL